jgi:hypothetical protein
MRHGRGCDCELCTLHAAVVGCAPASKSDAKGHAAILKAEYLAEAESIVRLFRSIEGRLPADFIELEAKFPGVYENGIGRPKLVR